MKAMQLNAICDLLGNPTPLELAEVADPIPDNRQIRIKVTACGVCHTEIDEIEGRTPPAYLPMIPGHQVVGTVEARGMVAHRFEPGDRVGVAWIGSACGKCRFCKRGQENLCADFKATGRDMPGGYAEYMIVDENFAAPIPEGFSDHQAAPLLCAGAIGYRSLNLTNLKDGQSLGLTGFGASAHLVLKMVAHEYPRTEVFVFARNPREREFAKDLGAVWAGETEAESPQKLDAIIDTTPAWKPVVEGLKNLAPGGRLVINAIRKEAFDQNYLLKLDYPEHLWLEKTIKSVANVTRRDVSEFLELAARIPLSPEVVEYPLADANTALTELKTGQIRGAKVLRI